MADEQSNAQLLNDLAASGKKVRGHIGEVYSGFARMNAAAFADGPALSAKVKQLMGIVAAISRECDGCIASHARGAAKAGATAAEVAEAIGVAIAMNGGPGTVYAARAYAAFEEFAGSGSAG